MSVYTGFVSPQAPVNENQRVSEYQCFEPYMSDMTGVFLQACRSGISVAAAVSPSMNLHTMF